jgi:TonB-dependent SusC/RagA subfamily outer membrane receptor
MTFIPSRAPRAALGLVAMAMAATSACVHRSRPARSDVVADSVAAADRPSGASEIAGAGASSARSRTVDVETMRGAGGAARMEELLIGRLAGVRVVSVPGGLLIRIRGASTLMGVQEPLYVVDGMPVEPGPGGLLAISPGEIATIEVLKDAASTSYYGVRGANGVVIIRTRR